MNYYWSTIGRHSKKTYVSKKGLFPLSPDTRECVRLVPKKWDTDARNLRHWLVRFCFCTKTPSEIRDLYKFISMPYSQPLSNLIKRQSERDFPQGSLRNGLIDGTNVSLWNKREICSDYCVLHLLQMEVVFWRDP